MHYKDLKSLEANTPCTPCSLGGTNLRAFQLVEKSPGLWEFVPTKRYCFLALSLMSLGIIMLAFMLVMHFDSFSEKLPGVVFAAAFIIAGIINYILGTGKIKLDFIRKECAWQRYRMRWKSERFSLSGAAALQILPVKAERVRGNASRTTWHYYELNIVTWYAKRYHLIAHGNPEQLRADAGRIAERLQIPIWELEAFEDKPAKRRKASVLNIIPRVVGWVFIIVALGIFVWQSALPYFNYIAAQKYQSVPCSVVECHVETADGKGKPCYRIGIEFEYEINAQKYRSKNFDVLRGSFSTSTEVETMHKTVAKYPAGSQAICYVNPDHPNEAYFTRTLPYGIWFGGFFSLIFALMGVLAVVCAKAR